ncbi:MAG: chromosomal replication initiator protein DnaA [Nitrospirae bacterium]|nr:chromosomal replication initiator protein DnaA [Nitrospirota bacterium]
MEFDIIWEKTIVIIKEKVGDQAFELWFRPIKFIKVKDDQLILEVPNKFFKEWIEDHFPMILSSTFSGQLKKEVSVKYQFSEKKTEAETKKNAGGQEGRKTMLAKRGIFLNQKFTFDSYVIGPSNQFANAASQAVADSPGSSYNPLFIYGDVGLGKTHLMNAIGNRIIENNPGIKLSYARAEQFTNEFIYSMRNNKMDSFKEKFRNLDALLIDDIQFIAGKSATQDELFHTFNSLYDRRRQIVFSSDRPPKDIADITERLRSRFGMGLIAEIQAPEVETKIAILGKKSELEGIHLPEDVALMLASRIKSNIRDLEAAMIRLGAHSSLSGKEITVEMARNILKDMIHDEEKALTVEYIQKTVCDYYGLKLQDIKAKKRTRDIAFPRQIAMHLCKTLTHSSLSDIGRKFGGKDHSTVIHACKLIEEQKKKDSDLNSKIEYFMKRLREI